jgi:hypothetical protein
VLARLAFDLCVSHRGKQEFLLVCEEAHRYVPADSSLGFRPTRRAIARIAKEGRKYGCYLNIVTQRPAELDPTILSQCSTIFAMRLSNSADQAIMRSAIPDNSAGALELISALNNREAIVFGEAVATGMRLSFAFQEDENLPRMSADWEDTGAQPEPAALPDASQERPSERSADPISAPPYRGWRGAARPTERPTVSRDWPSSEKVFGLSGR